MPSLVNCSQIRAARALVGWNQADLGGAIGVNERQMRFWEKRLPAKSRMRHAIMNAFIAEGIHFFYSPDIGFGSPVSQVTDLLTIIFKLNTHF